MKNEEVNMPLWLFNTNELVREFNEFNLDPIEIYSIHSLNNIIPSTILDSAKPNLLTQKAFTITSKLEELLSNSIFFRKLGCSTYIYGQKNT
jgi:hypothetical protein